jgi:hypothetical protein
LRCYFLDIQDQTLRHTKNIIVYNKKMSADCGENKFDPKKFEQDIGKLGEKMGMSQECIKTSKNKFSSFQASGKASILGGLGGSLSLGVSGTSSNDEKSEKGCGNFLLNASNIHNLTNNVKCTLNNNTSDMQVSSSASAKVKIQTRVSDDAKQIAEEGYTKRHEATLRTLALFDRGDISKNVKSSLDLSIKASEKAYQSAIGTLNMKGVVIKNKIKSSVKVLNVQQLKNSQDIIENVKKVANAAANAKLSETAGTNALTPNTKQLITQNISNNEQNITKNIQNIINNTKVKQSSDGTIEIISAAGINMKDVVIDQDVAVSIAAEAIQSSAIDMGLQTATEMTVDAASSSDTTTQTAGLNDLANELAKGNTDAIGKVMEGGWGSMDNLFIIGGVVIVGLALVASLGKMGGSRSKYASPPFPPKGFPPKGLPPPFPPKGLPTSFPPKGLPPPFPPKTLPKASPLPLPKSIPPPLPKSFPPKSY